MYYTVADMGCFDDYSDAAPHAKIMRGGWYYFVSFECCPMYHCQSKYFFTATLIYEDRLKSLYSRLGFRVIKYLAASPNFKEAHG